jgi:hypothetical protein
LSDDSPFPKLSTIPTVAAQSPTSASTETGDWIADKTSDSDASGSFWLIQPTFEYERIMYCPAHGFFDNRGTRGGTSYIIDENLNRGSEHLGHGGELVPFVFHHEWTGEWEVMNDVRDLGWNPEWTGANLDEYFDGEPFNGHYVSGYLDNDWIAGRVGVIHNNEVVSHNITDADNAYWLGSIAAFRSGSSSRWTLFTEDGREIADGLFDVKGGISAKYDENSKYFAIHNGDAWGVISIDGTVVVPYEFEDVMIIDNTRAYAKQDGKYGVVSLTDNNGGNNGAVIDTESVMADPDDNQYNGDFSIEGKWKNVGGTALWQAQSGSIIAFDDVNCNFYSPNDTYALYKDGDVWRLDVTGALFSVTKSCEVGIIDSDNIEVRYDAEMVTLKRVE